MSNEESLPSGEDQSSSASSQTAISRSVDREVDPGVPPENVTEDHMMLDAEDASSHPAVNGRRKSHSAETEGSRIAMTPSSPVRPIHPSRNEFSSPAVVRNEASEAPPMTIKDSKNLAELTELVKSSSPEVLQALLKANWRSFLFEVSSGTQTIQNITHLSFILRAGFKNSPSVVLDKVLNSAVIARPEAVEILSRKTLIADKVLREATDSQLLSQVPEKVLDQAFTQRLKVMPAKEIITMLAKADRLGYKHDDILDSEDESVMPYMPTPAQEDDEMTDEAPEPLAHHGLALPDTDPLLAEQERNAAALRLMPPIPKAAKPPKAPKPLTGGSFKEPVVPNLQGPLQCILCHRWLPNYSAFNFHIKKRVCQKAAPTDGFKWSCQVCGLGFTGKAGLVYHESKKVCQSDDIARATTPSQQLQGEAAASRSSQALPSIVDLQSRPREPLPPYALAPAPAAKVQIPLQTPNHQARRGGPITKAQDSEPRLHLSPSELPPDKLTQMNRQLAEQDAKYDAQKAAVATDDKYPSQENKRDRLISLKASDATRRSQIRKSFGVTLRMREKDKQALAASKIQNVRPSLEGFRRTSGPAMPATAAHSSSPIVGNFSPVNAPPGGPRHNTHQLPVPLKFGVLVPSTSPYSQPPPQSQYSPNLHSSPHFAGVHLPQAYSHPPLAANAPSQYNQFNTPQHQNQHHPNKRQRTSGDGTYSPNPGPNTTHSHPYPHPNQLPPLQNYPPPQHAPYHSQFSPHRNQGMSMVELRSEDAATRISQDKDKAQKSSAGWLKPNFETPASQLLGSSRAGSVNQAEGASQAALKSKLQDAVIVLSSSESESESGRESRAHVVGVAPSTSGFAGAGGSTLRVEISARSRVSAGVDRDADQPLPSVERFEEERGDQSPQSVRSPGGARGGSIRRRGGSKV